MKKRNSKKRNQLSVGMFMMIALLFLLPVLLHAQQPEGWLTPYANATFENGKIIYSIADVNNSMRLLPKMYPRNLVRLSGHNQPLNISQQDKAKSIESIRDFVNTERVSLKSEMEQEEYLRLSAMVLMWDMNLSEHGVQEIKKIKLTAIKTLVGQADVLLQVIEIYRKNKLQ